MEQKNQQAYTTMIRQPAELTDRERQAMSGLYLAHYDGSSKARFINDLQNKDEVLLISFNGTLIGFTTMQFYQREWNGQQICIVYSGDTVVERQHWGQQALSSRWISRMGELHRENPDLALYWFLIVKGHRTFRYLPAFAKSFWPHWSIDRSDLKPLVDALAMEKFGRDYNPATGVVAFAVSKGHLKEEIARPSERENNKEAVRFFLQSNPGYLRGHELVCLCELAVENMQPLTARIFRRAIP
ncbi:MAG: hypothetical protein QTN59_12690 [Candidatus Electrothrix communis]|nr:MAG: hypothetical protein QTN59_12690 [Candidatus Electrothrix communis]